MITNANNIIKLFGSEVDDEQIEQLWNELNTLNRPTVDPEDYDEDKDNDGLRRMDWVLVRKKGIELGFTEYYYQQTSDFELWGEGPLILTQVYFYSDQANDEVQGYQGVLPHRLFFADSRDSARQKMVEFQHTLHSNLSDTWDTDRYRINIQYTENNTINSMMCYQRMTPLVSEALVTPPNLSDIIKTFGLSVLDTALSSLWTESGRFDKEQIMSIREFNHLDLSQTYGITLHFTDSKLHAGLLKAITFHRNRDDDSIGWSGELPFDLDFDDDPITLAKKVNVAPIQHLDLDVGYRVWNLPEYTLHIVYNNIDNRLIRIKIIEKGIIEMMI